ncbi:hypothetical protein SCOCK_190037 [Actinacidiphila cocklensis]|uniref:Uncharacterized protein n=1 Tax=Actinacidiphila cocklensis TaxID=887465 RepID=A0A9W4DMU1_9ACTN|nr:hypothetical protein SCOCK_190037 [Actinacidiphila cocklensis]
MGRNMTKGGQRLLVFRRQQTQTTARQGCSD